MTIAEDAAMYTPPAFRVADLPGLHDFMEAHSFATLVTRDAAGALTATHLPLLLVRGSGPYGRIEGHVARANPQWREAVGEALVIYSGPHAYISPTWYGAEEVVPTWNYTAVHAYGALTLVQDEAETLDLLRRTVDRYEAGMPAPWTLERSGETVGRLLKGIVAFHLEISRLDGKWKLNQNHTAERRLRTAAALAERGGEQNSAVAALMRAGVEPDTPA